MTDQRVAQRSRTFLKAEIDLNGLSKLACIIKDLSDCGARLSVSDAIALPETFRLHLPKQDRWVRVMVRWRRAEFVGVHFEEPVTAAGTPALTHDDDEAAEKMRLLEIEVTRLRRMLEELRSDPSKIHQILDQAA